MEFLLAGPPRAKLLHADPHPGNYRITPDGRFGILDFGAVARLPDGLPRRSGADDARAPRGRRGRRGRAARRGLHQVSIEIDGDSLLGYL